MYLVTYTWTRQDGSFTFEQVLAEDPVDFIIGQKAVAVARGVFAEYALVNSQVVTKEQVSKIEKLNGG